VISPTPPPTLPPTNPPTTPPTSPPTTPPPTPPPTLSPTTNPADSQQPTGFAATACRLGTFVDRINEPLDNCEVCPIGEITGDTYLKQYYCGGCAMAFNEFEGGYTCSSCFAGQEIENNKSIRNTKCIDCKPGYYAYTPGDYSGYHWRPQKAESRWSNEFLAKGEMCTECPPNTYSGPRAAECITCPPGTTNDAARVSCVPTSNPSPTHAPTTAPPAITLSEAKCLPGQGYSADNCYDCPKGKYSSDGVVCLTCPRGTYSSVTRSTKCTQVQVGQVVNADSTGTITCQAGYYAPHPAGSAFISGYYNVERLKACTKCPPNMYAAAGQDRCERCPVNTEVNVTLDGCTPCKRYWERDYTRDVCFSRPK
jgi:Tyrosine-protein kinase ephrin type A/B receptor-like